jgi:hypothetical protein
MLLLLLLLWVYVVRSKTTIKMRCKYEVYFALLFNTCNALNYLAAFLNTYAI